MNYEVSDKVKYIHNTLCKIDKIYDALLKQAQMTDSEYVLLFNMLVCGKACSQKDIAENTYISTRTLNSTVKKLEQKGLIQLTPGKYPYRFINLTEKGVQYVQEKLIPIIKTEEQVYKNVSSEDFEYFIKLADKYIDMFLSQRKAN